jgi:hypothetical protein
LLPVFLFDKSTEKRLSNVQTRIEELAAAFHRDSCTACIHPRVMAGLNPLPDRRKRVRVSPF